MPTNPEQATTHYGEDDLLVHGEHLRPAWQAVLATIAMVAASVLVLAITG